MPFYLRIRDDGSAEVCESKASKLEIPSHLGQIWIDGDIIFLQFPSVDDIQVAGRGPMRIVSHLIRFPANEAGITSAEALLYVRREMLTEGNEPLLLAFAERGTEHSKILELYEELLS
jgi:hypothetical protein